MDQWERLTNYGRKDKSIAVKIKCDLNTFACSLTKSMFVAELFSNKCKTRMQPIALNGLVDVIFNFEGKNQTLGATKVLNKRWTQIMTSRARKLLNILLSVLGMTSIEVEQLFFLDLIRKIKINSIYFDILPSILVIIILLSFLFSSTDLY